MQVEGSFDQDIDTITDLAVVPVLKVLTMGALGTILAHPKINVISPMTTQLLSKLVFTLFLPCLIFTELGAAVTFENMLNWWFIPANVILSTIIGCLVGVLVALVCRPPPRFFRFVVVMTGVGNTGNIPLAVIGAICHTKNVPFGSNCKQVGVAYVAFSTWIAVIIVYTFVYHMLEPPECEEVPVSVGGVDEEEDPEVQLLADGEEAAEEGNAHPSVLEAEWPGLRDVTAENEHFRIPVLRQLWRGMSMTSQASVLSDDEELTKKVSCMKEPKMMRRLRKVAKRTPLEHILQPPTVASLLAIAVSLFPKSKGVLFGIDAPLGFVDDSFDIIATAMVPCIMLVLGGSLSGGPGKSELGLKTTIGVCVARLLLIPMMGIGVVQSAEYLGYIPAGDQMFKFVLLMHYTMPTAILCGAMASLRGYGEPEAAALMFWQHVFAVFSVTLYIAIYLNLLSYI
ncbi:hypothetical protein R1flu_012857 [Riccia fluitans]|uniref:Auxin efflux carrier family protein n=1 Tax=Riccia fluitans TaxID=41844 RepID=A0ABD1ZBS3_9MARC